MKNRTTIRAIAILTALAAAALLSVTPGGTRAQEGPFWNPLAGLSQYLQQMCENAWYESSASQTCEFRSGSLEFDRRNWSRCIVTQVECRMKDSPANFWWINDNWSGTHEELRGLHNCDGLLQYGGC